MLKRLLMQFGRRNYGRRNSKSKLILCGILFMVTVFRLMFSGIDSNNDAKTAFKQMNDVEYSQQTEKVNE